MGAALGCAYARAERIVEAVELLERAVESRAALRAMSGHSLLLTWLSEAYLLGGRTGDRSIAPCALS